MSRHEGEFFFFLHQPTVVVTIEICKEAVGYYYFYKLLFLWETTTFDEFYIRFSAPTKRVVPCVPCTHTLMVFTSLLISNGCISIYAPIVRKMTMKKKKQEESYINKNHSYEVYTKKLKLPMQKVWFPLQIPVDWQYLTLEPAMLNPSSQLNVILLG